VRSCGWILSVMLLSVAAAAEDAVFRDVQFPVSKEKLANASLRFSDEDKQIELRVSDGRVFKVEYAQIKNISYEYTSRHRIKEAIVLGIVSPWSAGAIIGITKSRSHWLEIDFQDQDAARALVLKLDKRDYQKICEAAKTHTGKDITLVGKIGAETIQEKMRQ
jgi:hypothetical protein